MIESWQLYFLVMLDNFDLAVNLLWMASLVPFGISLFIYVAMMADGGEKPEIIKEVRLVVKSSFISFFLFLTLATFVPNTKQAAVIVGVPLLIKSQAGQEAVKVPEKVLTLLNTYLDEQIQGVSKKESPTNDQ